MRAVIQRVKKSSVTVDNELVSRIGIGLLVLLGIEDADNDEDIDWLCSKIINLRIFDDTNGIMNLSVSDCKGEVLVVSQFTLHALVKKGNRPSYIKAAKPDIAIPVYNKFCKKMEELLQIPIKQGIFGANMQIELINDGPVTICIDTKNKE